MKAKLHKGPFHGKVVDAKYVGMNQVLYRGPKKMTRKQKWEWEASGPLMYPRRPYPQIEALYELKRYPQVINGKLEMVLAQDPDGVLFYEFVRKREVT